MSGIEQMETVFVSVAERTYGDEIDGSTMEAIQRWHLTEQVGLQKEEFSELREEAREWIEDAEETKENDIESPAKVKTGLILTVLSKMENQTDSHDPAEDPTFQ